jgi:hypothetical protein
MKLDPNTLALTGKIRIPKEEIRNAVGSGFWSSGYLGAISTMIAPFGV